MLKFDLVQTTNILTNQFATTEKSPIFQSHKFYKKPLAHIYKNSNMNKKSFLFLALLFITYSNFGQEKIAKGIYLYGVFENFKNGKTLISYVKSDKRTNRIYFNQKLEYKMVELFKKKGIKATSYGNLFGLFQRSAGNYLYTKKNTAELMNQNQIETLIKITLNNWPHNIVSISDSSFNYKDNSIKSKSTSEKISRKVRLIIEIYTKNDSFNKPLAILSVNTNKNWSLEKSYNNFTLNKLTTVLKLINNKNALPTNN